MDDLERELRDMLDDRVAAMPAEYDAPPALLKRARRRRATKLTALAVSVVIIAGGTVGAIAEFSGDDGARRVVTPTPTSGPPRPSVLTVECPVTIPSTAAVVLTEPTINPRVPDAGDPAELAKLQSFAAAHPYGPADSERSVVLGPESWSCHGTILLGEGMVVYDPNATPGRIPNVDTAPIAVVNDKLWREPFGTNLACSVFNDPAIGRVMSSRVPPVLCGSFGQRTVTRVNDHVATFISTNGARGAAWMVLPSSTSANDGKLSVLTCRPTEGLTAKTCDTIVADYAARLRAMPPDRIEAPSTTATTRPAVATSSAP